MSAVIEAPAPDAGDDPDGSVAERRGPSPRQLAMWALVLVLVGVGAYLPQYLLPFELLKLSNVLCFSFAVLGLALLTGFNGQISVGHGAFFGIGAYTTAILVADHDWDHVATLPVAALISFAVGLVVGLPALRIKGLYLALVTLALATLFPVVIQKYSDVTGGTQGKPMPPPEAPAWTGLANDQWIFYVQLVLLVIACVLVRNLVASRVGRGLIAVRDNEIAAEVVGVNVAAYRVVTFGISAMLAGLGGALFSFQNYVASGEFTVTRSIQFLVAMVIGGATSILGPIIGSAFIQYAPEYTADLDLDPALSNVTYGVLLIGLMLVLPGGVIGGLKRLEAFTLRKLRRGRDWRRAGMGDDAAVVLEDPFEDHEAGPDPER